MDYSVVDVHFVAYRVVYPTPLVGGVAIQLRPPTEVVVATVPIGVNQMERGRGVEGYPCSGQYIAAASRRARNPIANVVCRCSRHVGVCLQVTVNAKAAGWN